MYSMIIFQIFVLISNGVQCFQWPKECTPQQFYDPGSMTCRDCSANDSMVASADGFVCVCDGHSVSFGPGRCEACNATQVVSADGAACVPRRCQASAGKIVCRKCPNDYISVTQGFDGAPLKEVLCVKCARGYRAQDNRCVKCDSCVCSKAEIIVRGICVPKKFVYDRPKFEESVLHPTTLLEIVKQEYLCTKSDLRACRTLAGMCVKSFYSSDVAGPCRLWLQPQIISHKGLPQLIVPTATTNTNAVTEDLASGQYTLVILMAVHTRGGGLRFLTVGQSVSACLPPFEVTITNDMTRECRVNISKPDMDLNDIYELYLYSNGEYKPIPVVLMKPSGYYVERGAWSSTKFKKFFAIDTSLSTTANIPNTIYLKAFTILIKVEHDKRSAGSLRAQISVKLQYATQPTLAHTVSTKLSVEHEMPSAGVLRGLEIWGGVLGTVSTLYAVVQWRGVVRRGGAHVSLAPLLAAATADTLYFAALFSTMHALTAEAGTLGIALPMSSTEETVVAAFVYTVVSLKILKVLWINWCQCNCDIVFIDWSEYNPPLKDQLAREQSNQWRVVMLAKEWSHMQTKRRASPGLTVALTLIVLHVLGPWQSYMPKSRGYKWAVGMITWWTAYFAILFGRWVHDKIFTAPTSVLPKICKGVGLSLMVFQEDLYAHYVHGRYDACSDAMTMAGPLAKCRVVCAPQLKAVYRKLTTPEYGTLRSAEPNRILLTRFLAAFFERALDGLSWVASERTLLERLLDVELSAREGGATGALLYDAAEGTPSCFVVTWWGEEWTLATFDAMLFGCVLLATEQPLFAALATLAAWQVMKILRAWFGNKGIREKTEAEL